MAESALAIPAIVTTPNDPRVDNIEREGVSSAEVSCAGATPHEETWFPALSTWRFAFN